MARLLRASRTAFALRALTAQLVAPLFAASTVALALEVGGLAVLALGAYLIWSPAAFLVVGGGMILFAQGVSK